MGTLAYILLTTIKNKILGLKKKPGLLVLYIIIFAYATIFLVFISTNDINVDGEQTVIDIRLLYGIFAGILLMITYSDLFNGLSRGSTLFAMADMSLLFPSPISSIKILFYGMIKGMGTAFLTSIFLLFQYGSIKLNFDISNIAIISLFLIYAMIIFYSQLLSMVVYVFSNANSARKNVIKVIIAVFFVCLCLIIFYQYKLSGGEFIDAIYQTMDSKSFQFIPVIGWSIMLFSSIVGGNLLWSIIPSLLFFISGVGMVYIFTKTEGDYYEDVLVSTEFKHNVKELAKEGKTSNNKKVKIRKDDLGFSGGKGATTLFFKDLREKKRLSRIPFVDTYTLFVTIGSGVFVNYMKSDFSVYIVLVFLIYLQLFRATMGTLTQELRKPYIFLIPRKSLNKLVFASTSSLVKPAIDGIIVFTVACFISKTSPLLSVFLVLAYVSSSAMLVSYTLLLQRIFGAQPNQIVKSIVGVLLFIIVLVPGIILTVFSIIYIPSYLEFLGTLPLTLYAIGFSIIIFAICGNLIDKSEIVT